MPLENSEITIRLRDRREIDDLRGKIASRERRGMPSDRLRQKLEHALARAGKRSLDGAASRLRLEFPVELPVSGKAGEIAGAVRENQVVIVCGSTGSGKTTQLPKIALKAGYGRAGMIGCTQPRRIAATSMAERVAEETNCALGGGVGYQVRFDDCLSDSTVIKFMTDGILLAETTGDRDLLDYELIIVDEAHERSLNIDFILGYLKGLLARRPEMRVVISSATLDAGSFSAFFGGAPVIEVEGRAFPIEDVYLPPEEDEDLSQHILRAVTELSGIDDEGDILVFLPGEREIRDAADLLEGRKWPRTDILPLFARMGLSEQRKIFHPGRNRRVILSTNVAETSITIPRVHHVVDSGQVRLSRFNPRNQVQELQIEQVSQASARQRRGRCGRISDGICVYLYDEETMSRAPMFTDPEIKRSSLAGVILRMKLAGLPPIENFPLPDPPQPALIRDGYTTLFNIGALDESREMTKRGREMATLPLDPHLAAMVVRAGDEGVLGPVMAIAARLSMMDPRERPAERQQAADEAHRQWADKSSDFVGMLNLWNFLKSEQARGASNSRLRRVCKENFLNSRRVREWFNLFQDLLESVRDLGWEPRLPTGLVFEDVSRDHLHRALMAGMPTHLAKRDREEKIYRGSRDRKFHIFPGSALHKSNPEWILSFELVQTTKLYARQAAEVNPAWLEDVAPHLCRSVFDNIQWNRARGFVGAREVVVSSGLVIHPGRQVHYGRTCPAEAREIFIRDALAPGDLDTRGPWLDHHLRMLYDIRERETRLRRPDSLLDPEAVAEHFEKIIPPEVCSVKTLEDWLARSKARLEMEIGDAMFELADDVDWNDFPDWLEFLGHPFELEYHHAPGEERDGAIVLCPEEELGLLPDWITDWTVDGWLPEKVRLLLKTLSKDLRLQLAPLPEKADMFCADLKAGKVFRERPLLDTMAEYFSMLADSEIRADDFDPEKLPGYLKIKIGVLDKDGDLKSLHAGVMPDRSALGSRVGVGFRGADEWIVSGALDWPGDCPETIELDKTSGAKAHTALADEGESVGRHVFLNRREAEASHRRGLVRLYKILNADHIKFLARHLKISNTVKLTLSMTDKDGRFAEDIVDASIHTALTDGGKIEVRDGGTFRKRLAAARESLSATAEKFLSTIESSVAERDRIAGMLAGKNLGGAMDESVADIKAQFRFYFRPGFIHFPEMLSRYPRYFRALRLRAERLLANPGKDAAKMAQIEAFDERFRLCVDTVACFENSFDLQEFALALQEWRIAVFAPEAGTAMKISEAKLQEMWDRLRL